MKQLQLFVVLLVFSVSASAQYTITGTLTDSMGNPIAGQIVGMRDSCHDDIDTPFVATGITDASGNYTLTMTATPPVGDIIDVMVNCSYGSSIAGWCIDPKVTALNPHGPQLVNLYCANMHTQWHLRGYVQKAFTLNAATSATVYVIQAVDAGGGDFIVSCFDTLQTDSTGYFETNYTVNPLTPPGFLRVKAALNPDDPDYGSYLPTYYGGEVTWGTGIDGYFNMVQFIHMGYAAYTGGPAFISGSVLAGAGKGTETGDPLGGVEIIIRDAATDQPVSYTFSDADGHFSFPSLAYGSYVLHGDQWGKENPPLTVTVDATHPGEDQVVFEDNSGSFDGHIEATGITHDNALLSQITIGPVPAKDYITVNGLGAVSGLKQLNLFSADGQLIGHTATEENSVRLNTSSLPAGIYFLRIITDSGSIAFNISH